MPSILKFNSELSLTLRAAYSALFASVFGIIGNMIFLGAEGDYLLSVGIILCSLVALFVEIQFKRSDYAAHILLNGICATLLLTLNPIEPLLALLLTFPVITVLAFYLFSNKVIQLYYGIGTAIAALIFLARIYEGINIGLSQINIWNESVTVIMGTLLVCLMGRKTTNRLRNEQERSKKWERTYHSMFQNSLEAIFVKDAQSNKILAANPAAMSLFETDELTNLDELVRDSFLEEVAKKEIRRSMDVWDTEKAVERGNFEGIIEDKKGTRREVQVKIFQDRSYENRPLLFYFIEEVTARNASERKRQESERMYRAIVDNSPHSISLSTLDTQRIYLSPNIHKQYGYDSMEAYAKVSFLEFVHEDDRARVLEGIQKLVKGNAKVVRDSYRAYTQDKKVIIVEGSGTLVRLDDYAKPLLLIQGTNVTERETAKEALKEKEKEIEHYMNSNIELEHFAYIASHDLKQPLRTILNFSELLQNEKEDQLDEEANLFLKFIHESGERLNKMVNDMLDYSVIGSDSKLEPVSVQAVINTIKKDLHSLINDSEANIIANDLPKILGYETELRSLFQNLISNSIKYSRENVFPLIQINCKETDEHWLFSVKDNGRGFDPIYKNKIFNIFQRLENGKTQSGTGIGLAHCKKILDVHQGEIWAESEVNQGSTFWLKIPKEIEAAQIQNSGATPRMEA